jgi:hypothetical protein
LLADADFVLEPHLNPPTGVFVADTLDKNGALSSQRCWALRSA